MTQDLLNHIKHLSPKAGDIVAVEFPSPEALVTSKQFAEILSGDIRKDHPEVHVVLLAGSIEHLTEDKMRSLGYVREAELNGRLAGIRTANDMLQKERDELAAHVERQKAAMDTIRQIAAHPPADKAILRHAENALKETPAASLAHVRAEAIEGFGVWVDKECPADWFAYTRRALAEHYIDHYIRQSASQAGGEHE